MLKNFHKIDQDLLKTNLIRVKYQLSIKVNYQMKVHHILTKLTKYNKMKKFRILNQ